MKTIAVEYLHPIAESELSRLDFACKAEAQSNAHHKIPATQPLVSLLSPFISRIFQAGIYFALDGVRPILPGAVLNLETPVGLEKDMQAMGAPEVSRLNHPTNKITGEQLWI